jgi:hypothetical protein
MFITILAVINLIVNTAHAEPSVEIYPSKNSVEKGDIFQILIKITTTESINNIVIDPIPPQGFLIAPNQLYGSEIKEDGKKIYINHLEAGSEQIVSFKVSTPSLLGRIGNFINISNYKYNDTSSTEEPQSFAFNIFYDESNKSNNLDNLTQHIQLSHTKMINIRYTTDMSMYLIFGIIGIIFGHIIKISTQNRKYFEEKIENIKSFKEKISAIFNYIFLTRLPTFLTILAVGFSILILLAKESPPVNSWDQALALGIGLSLATDGELLSKFKP